MSNQLCIFDQNGDVSKSIDPAEVETLSDADRAVLEEVLLACRAAEDQDALVVLTRKLVTDKMSEHDAAVAADADANRPISHHDALNQVIAANNPGMAKIKPKKPNLKTRAALAACVSELATVRSDLTRALAKSKALSATRGEAILKWMQQCRKTVTFETVAREHIQRGIDERMARVARGEPAEQPKVQPIHQSEIDKVFAGRGKITNRLPAYHGSRKAF